MTRWSIRTVALFLLGTQAVQAATWNDLWWNRDQQGQRLLDRRQPAKAAELFDDGRRRGYAELEAGHYARAATLLGNYHDSNSQYNRGNALAHTGQLQEALQAYDAALAAAPGSADIVKNRDLVKKALEQQNQRARAGNQSSGAQRGGQGGTQTGGQPRAGSQGNAGPQGNAGSQGNAGAVGNAKESGSAGAQPGASGTSSGPGVGNLPNTNASLSGGQHAPPAQSRGSQTGRQLTAEGPNGAQAGNANGPPANQPNASPGSKTNPAGTVADRNSIRQQMADTLQTPPSRQTDGTAKPPPQPSEQSLEMDQWLRTIPDDSGELLQRKFMIEHLLKQRGNEP